MAKKCPPFDFATNYYQNARDDCVRQTSFFDGKPVLNQAVGYSVILGFGAFFAIFTSFLVFHSNQSTFYSIFFFFLFLL